MNRLGVSQVTVAIGDTLPAVVPVHPRPKQRTNSGHKLVQFQGIYRLPIAILQRLDGSTFGFVPARPAELSLAHAHHE